MNNIWINKQIVLWALDKCGPQVKTMVPWYYYQSMLHLCILIPSHREGMDSIIQEEEDQAQQLNNFFLFLNKTGFVFFIRGFC